MLLCPPCPVPPTDTSYSYYLIIPPTPSSISSFIQRQVINSTTTHRILHQPARIPSLICLPSNQARHQTDHRRNDILTFVSSRQRHRRQPSPAASTMFSCSNQPRGCRGRCDTAGGKCAECRVHPSFPSTGIASYLPPSDIFLFNRCTTSAVDPASPFDQP